MRGGLSTSRAKKKASAANGAKSKGRPRQRTFGGFLLRQKLREEDYTWVHEAVFHKDFDTRAGGARNARYQLEKFFGLRIGGDGYPLPGYPHWAKETNFRRKHPAVGSPLDRLLRQFRRRARNAKRQARK
jgi:hypothetical protein